ncbi:RNA-binding ribosome biosynthesis protein mak21 [Elasticomyces elasticus]|uniref:RNA-binding ribosome biosynthesis protein mak21 n=1 Tax=Exophiala sideris TaxID=1016849 RepID=A0ABR0JHC4_9EURO|nr:RNA-binding ribosome biosynthesis protein mak21 [Elasticomyces elasticus]KAK5033564.1 RNA-binding ribosome biosynthesis protein mak21 [Exophiala sideris]KAK5041941.1 RNA-binding ribosome biosynthesis protein mak21 [Exophiala sideris]KAK5064108.1 RNA-binding ribosome biosynthesis protein mak21 [Exophiala sideris]KAK5185209.1 RNA-binding ribosome biosynthesis protein mak21 [Eurotiomycetes sp. CCFEE 6388]
MSKKSRAASAPSKEAEKPAPAPSETTIDPQIGSFENLRNKIEARLHNTGPKTSKGQDKKQKSTQPDKKSKESGNAVGADRGKKRDRTGTVLTRQEPSAGENRPQKADDEDEVLRAEVEALGGTSEDLDLLAGAESDSELEGEAIKEFEAPRKSRARKNDAEGGLDNGMKNILKEIALAQGKNDLDQNGLDGGEDDEEKDEQSPAVNAGTQVDGKMSREKNDTSVKDKRGKQSQFLCDPKPDWYDVPEPNINTEQAREYTPSHDTIYQLSEYARSLLEEENQKFKESQQSSSAQSFYNTVITSGTLSDKVSALTLAVQESPIHNMRALESLMALARKKSRSQAVDVLRALKDLFAQGSLLPESRMLYAFHSQPALSYLFGQLRSWKKGDKLPRGLQQAHLVVWAFESWLKEQYFEVLKILENWCGDEIEYSKARAVSYVYELLKERPEQEANLLRLLVNKLGDPVKKIASQASYCLMQLLIAHPAMKTVVISAIEGDFIFRPGQSMQGRYYAVVTLNQTALSAKEEDVAKKLLDIYFGMFTGLLKPVAAPVAAPSEDKTDEPPPPPLQGRGKKSKKPLVSGEAQTEELREKLISAILTGVNRAYPYVGADGTSFSDHLETLFKITHSSNFNTSVQAMMLIQQLSSSHKASNDRFYRVLYESLLDPRLIIASKQQLYLNLLHRSLKADLNVKRVKAFVKRLLQILSLHEPSFICGAFFLIQDLESTFPSLSGLTDQPEDHDDDEEVFRDVDEDADDNQAQAPEKPQGNLYDGHKRVPEHANADNSCAWEILPFLAHFHPSVSVSADHILRHAKLPGKPDLTLHTLSHFLDRFVYRNAKLSSSGLRGSSIMQPMANDTQNVLLGNAMGAQRKLPVNSEAFRSMKGNEVAAEDVFFHQYFSSLGKATDKKVQKKKVKDEEEESGAEDEVWKAMMESAPDLEGLEDDEDDDIDLSELEDEMDASEGEEDEAEGMSKFDEGVDLDPAIFDEDEDDLMDLDDQADGDEDAFEGFGNEEEQSSGKKKDKKKQSKKRAKGLPTFATVEDYAKMLDDDEDEDTGR